MSRPMHVFTKLASSFDFGGNHPVEDWDIPLGCLLLAVRTSGWCDREGLEFMLSFHSRVCTPQGCRRGATGPYHCPPGEEVWPSTIISKWGTRYQPLTMAF